MPLMPTRRRILQAGALGIVAAPLNGLAPAQALTPETPALPTRRLFFRDPDRSSVRLSPDGRNIAWREPRDGVLNFLASGKATWG